MIYNVITSLNRFENLRALISNLSLQVTDNVEIRWHVITDRSNPFGIYFKQPWIEHYECHNEGIEFWERCHFALNWYLSSFRLAPDQYYCFLNDDDSHQMKFFHELDGLDKDVIVVSMKRGVSTPKDAKGHRAHGYSPLIAEPQNMVPGKVGLEQIVVKGKILSPCRIPMNPCGDGEMIEWIYSNHEAHFVPEVHVLFNFLEPGRWV
jgi:hypothetical protein